MKEQAVNTFDGGMVTDIDELNVKQNTLTYARNTEYITTEGNQLIIQKRRGRKEKINVTSGYNIKAVKVIDDVAYIVSTRAPREVTGQIITTYSSSSLSDVYVPSGYYTGQVYDLSTFIDPTITKVEMYLKATASTGTMRYVMYSIDGDGNPDQFLGATPSYGLAAISSSYSYVELSFTSPIDVSSYERVMIAIDNDSTSGLYVQKSGSSAAYPGGKILSRPQSGGTWSTSVGALRTHVDGVYTAIGDSELGTFPSPSYPSYVDEDTVVQMNEQYLPLRNFRTSANSNDRYYNSYFRTDKLNIVPDSKVHLELQKSYDGSVNMIFSSDDNPVRLINTKFKVNEDGTATLIKRRLDKNDNVYSEAEFHKTELIPRPQTVGYISSVDVLNTGNLPAGGYRYYFKYITADGIETDVFEESRTIDVHFGSSTMRATGGAVGEMIPKSNVLNLTNLDESFKGVKVYFSISAGDTTASTQLYKITNTFDISSSGTCKIVHSGYEDTTEADATEVSLSYTQIKNSKIITTVNNRLALSGTQTSLNHNPKYAELATYVKAEDTSSIEDVHGSYEVETDEGSKTHANPLSFYGKGEFWDGETYEIGCIFITDEGDTPVYPIQGIDRVSAPSTVYDDSRLGIVDNGFHSTTGQNPYGIFRTAYNPSFFNVNTTSKKLEIQTTYIELDVRDMLTRIGNYPEIKGYYFVKKKRKKDALMRGFLVPTVAIPTISSFDREYAIYTPAYAVGGRPGTDSILDGGYKWVPFPDMIMPFAVDRLPESSDNRKNKLADMQLRSCVQPSGRGWDTSYAIYSADIDCNAALAASMFTGRDFGMHVYKMRYQNNPTKMADYGSSYNKRGVYIHNLWSAPTGSYSDLEYEHKSVGNLGYVNEDTLGASSGAFAGSTDRNIWLWLHNRWIMKGTDAAYLRDKANDQWTIEDHYKWSCGSEKGFLGGNALKYGRYVGARFQWLTQINLEDMYMLYKKGPAGSAGHMNCNFDVTSLTDTSINSYFTRNKITGHFVTIYSTTASSPMSASNWRTKYSIDDNSKYVACTRRYPADQTQTWMFVGDGDCYSGVSWKRVFRPRGIDEAPQATDFKAYSEDKRDLGMADFGYAVNFPTKSNYNFHLRVPSNDDEKEYELFGQKRSFLPITGIKSIRGAKLDETDKFNYGYGAHDQSIVGHYRLNPDSPYYKSEQPNRIYVSDADIESNFLNGFTQFKGLSYRDYNSELGPIKAMVSFNGKIVVAFDNGVATVGVDERNMIQGSEGGIFTDSAEALASKSEVKSTVLGSDQPTSVISTSGFVYGVDTNQYKIWRTNGETFEVISDLKVQSWLKDTISTYKASEDSDTRFLVYTTYDARKSELLFTFCSMERDTGEIVDSKTLAYSELLQIWVCETDEHVSALFYIDENKYSIRPDFESSIYGYDHNTIKPNELNTEIVEQTILEFIVNINQNKVKTLENMIIVGNSVIPDTIHYTTDIYGKRNGVPILIQDINNRSAVTFTVAEDESATVYGSYGITFPGLDLSSVVNRVSGTTIGVNDLVTLISDQGTILKTKIVGFLDTPANTVVFADVVPAGNTFTIKYGHETNIRNFNSEVNEGLTYLSPSCEANSKLVLPRGKWVKVRMILNGADQMYITGIASVYNQSLS